MVNIGMVWLGSKPSLTSAECACSPILVESRCIEERGVGFKFF